MIHACFIWLCLQVLGLLDYEVCSSLSLLTVCSAVENFSVEYPLIFDLLTWIFWFHWWDVVTYKIWYWWLHKFTRWYASLVVCISLGYWRLMVAHGYLLDAFGRLHCPAFVLVWLIPLVIVISCFRFILFSSWGWMRCNLCSVFHSFTWLPV